MTKEFSTLSTISYPPIFLEARQFHEWDTNRGLIDEPLTCLILAVSAHDAEHVLLFFTDLESGSHPLPLEQHKRLHPRWTNKSHDFPCHILLFAVCPCWQSRHRLETNTRKTNTTSKLELYITTVILVMDVSSSTLNANDDVDLCFNVEDTWHFENAWEVYFLVWRQSVTCLMINTSQISYSFILQTWRSRMTCRLVPLSQSNCTSTTSVDSLNAYHISLLSSWDNSCLILRRREIFVIRLRYVRR